MVRPDWRPWAWRLGSGTEGKAYPPPAAAGVNILTASGDTETASNTQIFAGAVPEAATVALTVKGRTYTRDVSQTHAYLILLPDRGVSPGDTTAICMRDRNGSPSRARPSTARRPARSCATRHNSPAVGRYPRPGAARVARHAAAG